jgi:hypothetical protein
MALFGNRNMVFKSVPKIVTDFIARVEADGGTIESPNYIVKANLTN